MGAIAHPRLPEWTLTTAAGIALFPAGLNALGTITPFSDAVAFVASVSAVGMILVVQFEDERFQQSKPAYCSSSRESLPLPVDTLSTV